MQPKVAGQAKLMPIEEVVVGNRHRRDMGDLQGLADSIRAIGLLQPIGVTKDKTLIFGARRLAACRDVLQWKSIPTRVLDLAVIAEGEFVENHLRKDFTVSERVAILETLATHRHGGDRKSDEAKSDQEQLTVLDRDQAARQAGLGNRETARCAKIAVDRGSPEVVAAMDDARLSISKAAQIAQLSDENQRRVVEATEGFTKPARVLVGADQPRPKDVPAFAYSSAAGGYVRARDFDAAGWAEFRRGLTTLAKFARASHPREFAESIQPEHAPAALDDLKVVLWFYARVAYVLDHDAAWLEGLAPDSGERGRAALEGPRDDV